MTVVHTVGLSHYKYKKKNIFESLHFEVTLFNSFTAQRNKFLSNFWQKRQVLSAVTVVSLVQLRHLKTIYVKKLLKDNPS